MHLPNLLQIVGTMSPVNLCLRFGKACYTHYGFVGNMFPQSWLFDTIFQFLLMFLMLRLLGLYLVTMAGVCAVILSRASCLNL